MYHVQRHCETICSGTKRKMKDSNVSAEVLSILERLDERADARMEERERKMLLEAELEEKRREQERRHEERMQTLMLVFFSRLCHPPLHILCLGAITPITLLVIIFSTPLPYYINPSYVTNPFTRPTIPEFHPSVISPDFTTPFVYI